MEQCIHVSPSIRDQSHNHPVPLDLVDDSIRLEEHFPEIVRGVKDAVLDPLFCAVDRGFSGCVDAILEVSVDSVELAGIIWELTEPARNALGEYLSTTDDDAALPDMRAYDPTFYAVRVTGTYLRHHPDDNVTPVRSATRLTLTMLEASPGDLLSVRLVGDFSYGVNEDGSHWPEQGPYGATGIFVNADGAVIPYGQDLSTVRAIVTDPDCIEGIPTDIPNEFEIPPELKLVEIPDTAVAMRVAPQDSCWGDNYDGDGDYGVYIGLLAF